MARKPPCGQSGAKLGERSWERQRGRARPEGVGLGTISAIMAQVDGAGAGAGQPASEDVGAGAGGEPQATLELAVTQQPAVGATRPATSPTGPVSGVNLQLNQKGGGDGDANAMESTAALATASPSKYTPSGAIAPLKRPKSAYFLFMESVRSDVAKSLPAGSGVAEVAKGIGERWRALDEVAKKVRPQTECPQALHRVG